MVIGEVVGRLWASRQAGSLFDRVELEGERGAKR